MCFLLCRRRSWSWSASPSWSSSSVEYWVECSGASTPLPPPSRLNPPRPLFHDPVSIPITTLLSPPPPPPNSLFPLPLFSIIAHVHQLYTHTCDLRNLCTFDAMRCNHNDDDDDDDNDLDGRDKEHMLDWRGVDLEWSGGWARYLYVQSDDCCFSLATSSHGWEKMRQRHASAKCLSELSILLAQMVSAGNQTTATELDFGTFPIPDPDWLWMTLQFHLWLRLWWGKKEAFEKVCYGQG